MVRPILARGGKQWRCDAHNTPQSDVPLSRLLHDCLRMTHACRALAYPVQPASTLLFHRHAMDLFPDFAHGGAACASMFHHVVGGPIWCSHPSQPDLVFQRVLEREAMQNRSQMVVHVDERTRSIIETKRSSQKGSCGRPF